MNDRSATGQSDGARQTQVTPKELGASPSAQGQMDDYVKTRIDQVFNFFSSVKRIVLITVWTFAFFWIGVWLCALAMVLFWMVAGSPDKHSDLLVGIVTIPVVVGPWIAGLVGLLMGISGKLPGTRRNL